MTTKNKPLINIKSIQREYLLSFRDVLKIAQQEQWKVISAGRKFNYERDTVESHFLKNGIPQKAITYVGIMDRWNITKDEVFKIIRQEKWQPLSTKGALWTYPYAPIEEYFLSLQYVYDTNNK